MMRTGDRQFIKELNIALVMNVIRQHQPIARVDISDRTGLGRSTITGIINTLIAEGVVKEIGSAQAATGRKPMLLTFDPHARYAIGIKIAQRGATVALVDLNAHVLHMSEAPLPAGAPPAKVVAALTSITEQVLRSAGAAIERVLGIGVVAPGVINPATGTAIGSHVLGWESLPIRDLLAAATKLPVYVDNDANAMALAELLYGAGRGVQDLLVLTVGVGIGAGVIIGGQIHRGYQFGAGEMGHMRILPDGPLCACGRRGCLEALAGDGAIVRLARAALADGRLRMPCAPEQITREEVVAAARRGDEGARSILSEVGHWLGVAVGNAINLLSPSRIVIGGEAALDAGDLLLKPLRNAMTGVTFLPSEGMEVVLATLGDEAWVKGAAALVLTDAFQVPLHQHNTLAMARRMGKAQA